MARTPLSLDPATYAGRFAWMVSRPAGFSRAAARSMLARARRDHRGDDTLARRLSAVCHRRRADRGTGFAAAAAAARGRLPVPRSRRSCRRGRIGTARIGRALARRPAHAGLLPALDLRRVVSVRCSSPSAPMPAPPPTYLRALHVGQLADAGARSVPVFIDGRAARCTRMTSRATTSSSGGAARLARCSRPIRWTQSCSIGSPLARRSRADRRPGALRTSTRARRCCCRRGIPLRRRSGSRMPISMCLRLGRARAGPARRGGDRTRGRAAPRPADGVTYVQLMLVAAERRDAAGVRRWTRTASSRTRAGATRSGCSPPKRSRRWELSLAQIDALRRVELSGPFGTRPIAGWCGRIHVAERKRSRRRAA